jgi:hypothetical protein
MIDKKDFVLARAKVNELIGAYPKYFDEFINDADLKKATSLSPIESMYKVKIKRYLRLKNIECTNTIQLKTLETIYSDFSKNVCVLEIVKDHDFKYHVLNIAANSIANEVHNYIVADGLIPNYNMHDALLLESLWKMYCSHNYDFIEINDSSINALTKFQKNDAYCKKSVGQKMLKEFLKMTKLKMLKVPHKERAIYIFTKVITYG